MPSNIKSNFILDEILRIVKNPKTGHKTETYLRNIVKNVAHFIKHIVKIIAYFMLYCVN